MHISHVIRAEEHLPNTLRQALIYKYKEMGYLPQAMVNYLALLGWGDGTENEFFPIDDLVKKFAVNRVNKSGAVFDATKLKWIMDEWTASKITSSSTRCTHQYF